MLTGQIVGITDNTGLSKGGGLTMAESIELELPNISITSSDDEEIKFPEDLRGQWTVIYFYPKDDTPGCTKQACAYRDNIDEFKKNGIVIYGVSADDLDSHAAFIEKYSLNFPLLVDTDKSLQQALDVSSRDSFLIDPEAKVAQVWRGVDPVGSVSETLTAALAAKG